MSDLVSSILLLLRKEFDKPEWKQEVLEPITKWISTLMIPYALGLICINFFLTIAAVSLVLYVYKR
jgi:hypothetical protein